MYLSFGDCSKSNYDNWWNRLFHFPHFFSIPWHSKVLTFLFGLFSILLCGVPGELSLLFGRSSFFLLTEIRWSFSISKSVSLCISSPRVILNCANSICFYGQTLISYIIPNGSPSRIKSYTLSMIRCCIRLYTEWCFDMIGLMVWFCPAIRIDSLSLL